MLFFKLKRNTTPFPGISIYTLLLGALLGILGSISFYLLFNVCREALRIFFSNWEYHDLWYLSPAETWFYNLIFAFISCIMGEALCLKIWFENIHKQKNTYFNYKRKLIINDLFVLNFSFLSFFGRLAIIFAFFIGFDSSYLDTSIPPKYNWVWFLLIIVLHLEQWKTIRRISKKNSLKGFLLITGSIIIIASSMAFINPIDYQGINAKFLSKSVDYNYYLRRPVAAYTKLYFPDKPSLMLDLFYVYPKGNWNDSITPTIIIKNEIIPMKNLDSILRKEKEYLAEYEHRQLKIKIHCDKNTCMKHLKQLKYELSKSEIYEIILSLTPSDYSGNQQLCRNYGIRSILPNYQMIQNIGYSEINDLKGPGKVSVVIMDSTTVNLNGKEIGILDISTRLDRLLGSNKVNKIQIYAEDEVPYQTYITVRSIINKAVLANRNQISQEYFSKDYHELNEEDKRIIYLRHRIEFIELPDTLYKLLQSDSLNIEFIELVY